MNDLNFQKKLLAIILCTTFMAGCSKKLENAEEAVADVSNSAKEASVEANATESAENEPNTTPTTAQKPEVILNPEVNHAEATRRMVREANVIFTAKDVVKSTLEIEKIASEAGGFVEQKNIDFNVVDTQSQAISDGKIKIFEKIDPLAAMIIRVPSENAAVVVNKLLPLMYFLNQQQYSAKRYELKLLEEKIAQTQSVASETKNQQLSEIARLTRMEVQDRVRYSTITIAVNQPSLVRERIDIDIDAVARLNSDSFWKRSWNGIQYGWQFVLDLLVILISIWPLYLIIIVLYFFYRLLKPFIQKINKE